MFVTSSGLSIYYETVGDGSPVLLLHGFPDTGFIWRNQVAALVAAGYRAIVPDLRGYGQSDKPSDVASYFLPNLITDMVTVLDEADAPRARIVGHDQGSVLAWTMASLLPERVSHLVALSVGHPNAFRSAGIEQQRRSWYMLLFQHAGIAETWLEANAGTLFDSWGGHPDGPDAFAKLRTDGSVTPALHWYRANVPPSMWTTPIALPPVTAPTLGIWGSADSALTEAQMKRSGDHVVGQWRFERVEGAGHWLQVTAHERVNQLVVDFLGGAGDT